MKTIKECDHGLIFEKDKAKNMTAHEVRNKYPRLYGQCPHCDYNGIAYVSMEHFIAGDW